MNALVSIIMPVYNAEKYLSTAIESVLNQTHRNWELIIINDGSTDQSQHIISKFSDPRIVKITQQNKGVSVARNKGLDVMKGDYFCFLDADDFLPKDSLSNRLKIFKKSEYISFVDGGVLKYNESMTEMVGQWIPNFEGNPLKDLILLTGQSFFGPTWMIKNNHLPIRFSLTLCHSYFE